MAVLQAGFGGLGLVRVEMDGVAWGCLHQAACEDLPEDALETMLMCRRIITLHYAALSHPPGSGSGEEGASGDRPHSQQAHPGEAE